MESNTDHSEWARLRVGLVRRFNEACAQYGLIEDGDHILVGLSGGKDSLALVELLGQRARIYVPRFRVTAVHVRIDERKYLSDTQYLEDFCRQWDVPFIIRDTHIEGEETKDACFLCSWYRRKVLFDLAQELGCNKVALGHHRDDILETLLMNLIYQGHIGTIPPRLAMRKMPIALIRPLCMIDEKDLQRYAVLNGYRTPVMACPYEKASSRSEVKALMSRLEALNPHVRDSMWHAMENIKADGLPKKQ